MACSAVEPELYTEGGEVAFMTKIIQESATSPSRHHVKWFTCMVGIKADLAALKSACSAAGAVQVRSTTFYQGQTLRWGLAWTFAREQQATRAAKRALQRGERDVAAAAACTEPGLDPCLPLSKKMPPCHATLADDDAQAAGLHISESAGNA